MSKNGSKTLIGLRDILAYLEISEKPFKEFVKLGLPARVHNRNWYAHTDNIDDFFKRFTRHRVKEIPPDAD